MASSMEAEQIEEGASTMNQVRQQPRSKHIRLSFLLLFNAGLMTLGAAGGPLLLRLYFVHGGKRLWLSTLVQLCGSPLLLLPLYLSYIRRRRESGAAAEKILLTPELAAPCVGIGLLMGGGCYLYTMGTSYLPLTTSSIIVSSQLAFTAVFAFFIVRQRFTPFSLNSVLLLTMGPVVLSLHASGDRPEGESNARYYLGFAMAICAAATTGGVMPLVELLYMKTKKTVTYALVMEMQFLMGLTGAIFCLVGMAINKDFQAIPRESREFDLGQVRYYVIIVIDTIFWQLMNVGMVGLISGSSSLLAGILVAVLLPVTEVLSVIVFHDKFDGSKGIALVLSLWGFVSYLYGERRQSKKLKKSASLQLPSSNP